MLSYIVLGIHSNVSKMLAGKILFVIHIGAAGLPAIFND